MAADILEHSFRVDDGAGEFVMDGYGGEFDHVYMEAKAWGERGETIGFVSRNFTESQIAALHAYLEAWLRVRLDPRLPS